MWQQFSDVSMGGPGRAWAPPSLCQSLLTELLVYCTCLLAVYLQEGSKSHLSQPRGSHPSAFSDTPISKRQSHLGVWYWELGMVVSKALLSHGTKLSRISNVCYGMTPLYLRVSLLSESWALERMSMKQRMASTSNSWILTMRCVRNSHSHIT